MKILDRPLTSDEAAVIGSWSYPPPYDLYNNGEVLGNDYRPVYATEELIGFVCFGAEARVRGQVVDEDVVDVGAGLRPDLTGQGVGTTLMPLVEEYARQRGARRLRAAIAAFNERSQRMCRSAGFVEARRFEGPQGREFVELELPLRAGA